MKKSDFNKRVDEIIANVSELVKEKENQLEDLSADYEKFGGAGNVFRYAAVMEHNFEANLRDDYERKTTFTYDFSIAEWFVPTEGVNAVLKTFKNAAISWRDNVEFFAELIIAANMKSWELHARNHRNWSALYAELYYGIKDLYFDWFDDEHEKHGYAMQYYYDYID